MNIAIHGDKELLVRLREDLIENGVNDDETWNEEYWDKYANKDSDYLHVSDYTMLLLNHTVGADETIHLTPSNYNEVLETILNSFKNK